MIMAQFEDIALQNFGLSEKEIKIYKACLGRSEVTPTDIAKITKLPRSSIYDIAFGLALKGLLTLKQSDGIQKQQTLITAVNPEQLRNIIHKKRDDLFNLESDLLEAIPRLKGEYFGTDRPFSDVKVEVATGLQGFQKLYYETNREVAGQSVYAWDSWLPVDTFGNELGEYDVREVVKRGQQNPHEQYEIIPNNERVRLAVGYYATEEPGYFTQISHRYVENPLFDLYNRIEIRGHLLYFFSSQRDEIYVILIRSKNLAESLKQIFLLHWQFATPLDKTVLNRWSAYYQKVWGTVEKRRASKIRNKTQRA